MARTTYISSLLLVIFISLAIFNANPVSAEEAFADDAEEGSVIITLTQVACSIIEAEEEPTDFIAESIVDCQQINKETKGERTFIPLVLESGPTIFRVANESVPYELGFWLRGKGVGRLTQPSIKGNGIFSGEIKDFQVDLKPGEYYFSCPLNPTPDYTLIVR